MALFFSVLFSSSAQAQVGGVVQLDKTRWISIGTGLRTSFATVEDTAPSGSNFSNEFEVESIRLYLNGQVSKVLLLSLMPKETQRIQEICES